MKQSINLSITEFTSSNKKRRMNQNTTQISEAETSHIFLKQNTSVFRWPKQTKLPNTLLWLGSL